MVAPGDGQARLMHQDLDDLVETRATVAQVPGDNNFKDGQMPDHSRGPVHGFQALVFGGECIKHRLNIRLGATSLRFPQKFAKERLVIYRESAFNVSQAIALRQRG